MGRGKGAGLSVPVSQGSLLESTQAISKLVKKGCCLFSEGQFETLAHLFPPRLPLGSMASRGSLRYLFMDDSMLTGAMAHLPQMPHHP